MQSTIQQTITISFLFIFLLLPLSQTLVEARESQLPIAPIMIDGEPVKTRYMVREGHLLVPAVFMKHTGAFVNWNENYRSVSFRAKDFFFALPVGQKRADVFDNATRKWKSETLTTETIEFKGQPFVPLVDVAKKLGMTITYDRKLNRTSITTNIDVKPNEIFSLDTTEKLVALSFDDGPEDVYTPRILDILKEKGVPATFFVMGQEVVSYPELMKRIVNEGHGIGNHTWNHPDLRRQWSSVVSEEIKTTQQALQQVVGKTPDLFRPPYGAITKADKLILNQMGLRNVIWSVDTLDYSGLPADDIVEIVHRKISPGGIILQHNFKYGRLLEGTVEALPRIIDELEAKGYTFVTLQTLLETKKQ